MKTINLFNICKTINNNVILNNIHYSFYEGKVYLLIGCNGSGKSSLIKAILGLYKKTGEIINGFNNIAYVPERLIFPEYITIWNFLYNLGLIRKINKKQLVKNIKNLLLYFDLYKMKNKKLNYLSKGMLQKVLIIQALIQDADLYIFDEALNGLDINMQKKFLNYINKLKKSSKTIIITTHYEKYFEGIYDQKITVEEGKLVEKFNYLSY